MSREAFEQWWDGAGGWHRHDKRSTACLAAWDAWQAATAMQEARVRELEEEAREWKEEYELLASAVDHIGHDRDNEVIKELAMLVKRLSSALRVAIPKSRLPDNAMNYLHRLGAAGSPLREKH